ncbi:transposase [Streptomyces africanus]|uniref:transposase n=1 Tax=Streptomyces africanus TaxID=231024 RepID=UPI003520B508
MPGGSDSRAAMGRPPPHSSALAWKYRTNSPWRGPPDELGSFQTFHKRLIRWAVDGTWEMILAAVLAADADDDIDWTISVDSTAVPAHQHAAGALERGRPTPASPPITRSDPHRSPTLFSDASFRQCPPAGS